jgi:alpha-L-fucosidase
MCIGNWHYNRRLLENHTYQKASFIIPLFVDIVSKNGNLLLSIPLPGHGQPDSDEIAFLNELAEWQQVNSEAIKGTRPWNSFGEGPSTETKKTAPYQLSQLKFDHTDIRFTTKGKTLYAIALGWPTDGKILIRSLAEDAADYPHHIRKVELLGATSELKWTRGAQGLAIRVPDVPPCKYAFSFRILAS